ncbi:hypothetical protein [Pseudoxanthomonas kaohsiungensis]|uniref:Uncharacterized protein n=1 Tax=Pseudoxanthomonas kaohsiungensis TaxID=283923 RepID=A0ABW3LXP8_9GAMM|nr:hypothetical protein [Pseudoxanthomonas kaohsiungensis]
MDELEQYVGARQQQLTSEELEAPDPLLVSKVLAAMADLGVDEDALDELVHEAVMEEGMEALNLLQDAGAQQDELDSRERAAATLNNEGRESQVRALAAIYGNEGLLRSLREILAPATPRP